MPDQWFFAAPLIAGGLLAVRLALAEPALGTDRASVFLIGAFLVATGAFLLWVAQ